MLVEVNGQPLTLPDPSTSLATLVREQCMGATHVAVAVNGVVVPRSQHAETRLQDGDRIEVVQAVGGG
ncbi:MAG: sulfur carrier protein ThiS [Deltaproteobacteria bacterium]|nr:sulfur carrier protein ThiS [Deltaproteobacteria bacterium]